MLPQESSDEIRVAPWRTERPLFVLNAVVSAVLWFILLGTPQSLAYVGLFVVVMSLLHIRFIAIIRGSAVRLGPDQFPELHTRVCVLAHRMGLRRAPDVYLMQQDGALNAFATRFLRTHIVVLFSDLVEACGENRAAVDMIIGHELGHIRRGHLLGYSLLMPASFVPFLGSALSRAREYTCDRYGLAAAGDHQAALIGLSILAAGSKYGPLVNREALVRQRGDLRGAWMHVGEWLVSHPPLSRRLVALATELGDPVHETSHGGVVRSFRMAFAMVVVIAVGSGAMYAYLPGFGRSAVGESEDVELNDLEATAQVNRDFDLWRQLLDTDVRAGRELPWDTADLYDRWSEVHADKKPPVDPFDDGYWYGYSSRGTAYRLFSYGPDRERGTADDIEFDSRKSLPTVNLK
jgi:Zn-dependent protease with chaperone function